ncbi:MAG: tetratricopeptide repeat protein [Ahrensia sp.]|nr:tetratricopeptide repeat protein [Ahrensia sp.]
MLKDRYGYSLSTQSSAARDAYVEAVDRFLAAEEGIQEGFETALKHDPDFALAHIGAARYHQLFANRDAINLHLDKAKSATGLSDWETTNVELSALILTGKGGAALPKIREHLLDYPRDAMLAQTCMGVFGLIGFSGQPGREAEMLAFSSALAPHYGEDWWYLGAHSFSQMEAGQHGRAERSIEASIAKRPTSANGAHYRSHLYYETGDTQAGYDYLRDWMQGYSRVGFMHTHLSWHTALWALAQGDEATMWAVVEADVDPAHASGPALNIVTDTASILHRAELAGVEVSPQRWAAISDYAANAFPKPGLGFADVHAALAHAMAGQGERLARIISDARGPAADVVRDLAEAFRALAKREWANAEAQLAKAARDHARIGGSRAQRDLIDYSLAATMLRQGRGGEARRLIALRRPIAGSSAAIAGLADLH